MLYSANYPDCFDVFENLSCDFQGAPQEVKNAII